MNPELYEKTLKAQNSYIREMEKVISGMEEEISIKQQLIEALKEENRLLQKHLDDYAGLMRQILKDPEEK